MNGFGKVAIEHLCIFFCGHDFFLRNEIAMKKKAKLEKKNIKQKNNNTEDIPILQSHSIVDIGSAKRLAKVEGVSTSEVFLDKAHHALMARYIVSASSIVILQRGCIVILQ